MDDLREQLLATIRAGLEAETMSPLRARLAATRPEDIAEVLDLLDSESQVQVIQCLEDSSAADVISRLEEGVRVPLLDGLDSQQVVRIVGLLTPDDAADMMGELPQAESAEILENIPAEKSATIEDLMTYPPETAGGLMTPTIFTLPVHATVRDAIRSLRGREDISEDEIYNAYVTDAQGRLVGRIPMARLLTANPDTRLDTLKLADAAAVSVLDDQEEVLNVMRRYDLASVPVVDELGRMVGRITHDDVLDVAEEEAAEDLYLMAGTNLEERESPAILHAVRIRFSWLLPCMVGASVTAAIMELFSKGPHYPYFLILVPFCPLVNATGGNTGIQTSTMIVRGLATGDLSYNRLLLVFMREGRIVLFLAGVCSITAGLLVRIGDVFLHTIDDAVGVGGGAVTHVSGAMVGLSVGLGMFCAILASNILAISLPFGFRRLGIDPAIASGPLITTANDMVSVAIYLSIGMAIIA